MLPLSKLGSCQNCRKLQGVCAGGVAGWASGRQFSAVTNIDKYGRVKVKTALADQWGFKRRQSTHTEPIGPSASGSGSSGSVKVEEVEKFERMSSSWWDQSGGQMKELHSMNRLRIPLIRDGLLQRSEKQVGRGLTPKPLTGITIMDIGCGGGILCEPLGRLGANVTGIDPGQGNITVARNHLSADLMDKVLYECISIEDFVGKGEGQTPFDAVVMSEVIEHVESPENFVKSAAEVLKPGGSLFLTTLNRTTESWMGAIVAWEYLLRKLPVGTHDWRKFLTPAEVERIFKSNGLRTILIHGMCYNPVNNTWKWSNQRTINYAVHAIKE